MVSTQGAPGTHGNWPWQHAAPPHPQVIRIPAFQDNYLWLITDMNGHAIVVDPGDAAPVQAALAEHGLSLTAILITHHHADHTGGVKTLIERWQCPVFGPAKDRDRIPTITDQVVDGDTITRDSPALTLQVIEVPGHTTGHIAYFIESLGEADSRGLLFCGDTLFAGGCGRMFEGRPAQMLNSLNRLAALPADTLVHCAHEYTMANLRFALTAEPDNPVLKTRASEAAAMREAGLATVPSSMGTETATNPFLRTAEPAIRSTVAAQTNAQASNDSDVFAGLRAWKDTF